MGRLLGFIPLVFLPFVYGLLQYAYAGIIEHGQKLGWIASTDRMATVLPSWSSPADEQMTFFISMTMTGVLTIILIVLACATIGLFIYGPDEAKTPETAEEEKT